MSRSRWTKILAVAVGALFLFLVVLGMYWSPMPKLFWVNEYVEDQRSVVGYSTTNTLIRVAETLLDKRGGYISNDRFPPGVWLDNMPNWEKGVLTQVRDLSRAIRQAAGSESVADSLFLGERIGHAAIPQCQRLGDSKILSCLGPEALQDK